MMPATATAATPGLPPLDYPCVPDRCMRERNAS
jgi:hypothetical protein